MKAIRVLHVVGAMNMGGIETWLMHILRHIDREQFQMDFLVQTDQPAPYDAEVRALGSMIHGCPNPRSPVVHGSHFLRILKQFGPFDVLHSHVHHFSGYVLALGRIAGIPVRIAHSHNDTRAVESKTGLARRIYLNAMQRLIAGNCTQGLAASQPAAADLFGHNWQADRRFRVLYYGIDLHPFRKTVERVQARKELGFSEGDLIFGHVGRFSPQKNHAFLIDLAAEVLRSQSRARFLLIGDGPLRPAIEKRVRALGLSDRILFAGLRQDIPQVMMSVMDVLLFPSHYEGLGIVLIEAQAAGLRCLVSEAIPEEAVLNPELVQRLPLSAGAREWARTACRAATQLRVDAPGALRIIEASRFAIDRSVQELAGVYLRNTYDLPRNSLASRSHSNNLNASQHN